MQFSIILFTSLLMVSAVSSLVTTKRYRTDYEYNKKTDAFYKLHIEGEQKNYASRKCIEEGAELAMITSDEDLKQIHAMMKKFPDLESSVLVASNSLHHDSFEEEDTMSTTASSYSDYGIMDDNEVNKCTVVNNMGEIETVYPFAYRPFVCKVAAKDTSYNDECGVYSNGYESKISTTGSCYRVSTTEATWNEAYANCQAEGAHLVILNDAEELEIVYNMLKDKPRHSETQYFAGVRAVANTDPRVFKTVLNQTLEEVGYGPWEEGEPNDWHSGENCVALDIRRHAKYNDVWCYVKMKYVCESAGNNEASRMTDGATQQSAVSANVLLSLYSLFSMLYV